MSEADTLALLSMSTEVSSSCVTSSLPSGRLCKSINPFKFHQLQVRENEVPELQALMKDVIPCQVKVNYHRSEREQPQY